MPATAKPTYTIQISDEQRAALLELVRTNIETLNDDHPLAFWEGMLSDLPEVEAEHPGITHAFNL